MPNETIATPNLQLDKNEPLHEDESSSYAEKQPDYSDLIKEFDITALSKDEADKVIKLSNEAIFIAHDAKNTGPGRHSSDFLTFEKFNDELWGIDNDDTNIITDRRKDAYRLFSAALIDQLSTIERRGLPQAADVYQSLRETFFGSSPDITSYSGSIAEKLDLVALGSATPYAARLTNIMIGDIVYTASFSKSETVFDSAMQNKPPTMQLRQVGAIERAWQNAYWNGSWAEPAARSAAVTLSKIANGDIPATTFTSLVAQARLDGHKVEYIDLEQLPLDEQNRLLEDYNSRKAQRAAEQASLIENYPELQAKQTNNSLVRLAKDMVAVASGSVLGDYVLETDTGRKIGTIDAIKGDAVSGLSPDDCTLISELHKPDVLSLVEDQLQVKLNDLSFESQLHLLRYMTEADKGRYEHLTTTLAEAPVSQRQELAEAFLATEYGDDLGDILLTLAEQSDQKQLSTVLEHISQVRSNSRQIAEHFRSADPADKAIAEALPTAFTKRTTELLALASQEAVEAVQESLMSIQIATRQINESLQNDSFSPVNVNQEFGSFQANQTPVTVTVRPFGANARIGFTVRYMGSDKKQRLNIRLDYEDGALSLDIGSMAREGVNSSPISRQVGSDLARGELALANLRAHQAIAEKTPQYQEIALNGNHVREAFIDVPQLEPDEFAGVANRFMYRLRYEDRSPGAKELQKSS